MERLPSVQNEASVARRSGDAATEPSCLLPAAARQSKAERSAATRTLLLREARRLFAAKGFAATSAEDVLQALSLTRGALYHQFDGMRDLFSAVCREVLVEANANVCAAAAAVDGEPVERLREGCIAYLRLAIEPEYVQIALTDGPAVLGHPAFQELAASAWVGTCRDAVGQAIAAGCTLPDDVDAAMHVVDGALTALSEWSAAHPEPERLTVLARAEAAIACLIQPRP